MASRYTWKKIEYEPQFYPELKDSHQIIHSLLSQRGIKIGDETKFLIPHVRDLNDFLLLPQINEAVDAIKTAIDRGKKIFIHGDYDVDGISATSIVWDYLYRHQKAQVTPIIPSRFTEGYGLSALTLNKIIDQGGSFVITVDCGIKDAEIIDKFKQLDFVITDHHSYPPDSKGKKISAKAKNLLAVVHPQHPKSEYPFTDICGTTVAWKLIQAFEAKYPTGCDVYSYLSLVALATVTDIMPLKNENRIILACGLNILKKTNHFNIHNLLLNADINKDDLEAYHFGYIIGPRLNAAGRLEDALDAVRLLVTQNTTTANEIISKLSTLNLKRQQITIDMLSEIEEKIKQIDSSCKIIFVVGEEWSEGVVGLAAGKICEKYNKPVIVGSIDPKTGIVKASARSIPSYNISEALGRYSELLLRFGGHAQAAGLTFDKSNFEKLLIALQKDANERIKDEDLVPVIKYSEKINLADLNLGLIDAIDMFQPFGFGNPNPLFYLKNLEVIGINSMGKEMKHIKLTVSQNGNETTAIAFNQSDAFKNIKRGDMIDVIGSLKINEWRGNREVQIEIKDFKGL